MLWLFWPDLGMLLRVEFQNLVFSSAELHKSKSSRLEIGVLREAHALSTRCPERLASVVRRTGLRRRPVHHFAADGDEQKSEVVLLTGSEGSVRATDPSGTCCCGSSVPQNPTPPHETQEGKLQFPA